MADFEQLYNPRIEENIIQPDPQLNPISDPFSTLGVSSNGDYINKALGDLQSQLAAPTQDAMLRPVTFNPTVTQRDRYVNSDYFGELGFNPFSDNEEIYGNRQTNMNKLKNAFVGMGALAWNQAVDQFQSWGDTFNFVGDQSISAAFQQAEMEELAEKQKQFANSYAIFETQAQRDSVFNFNTIANTLQQSGYAVGAIAEIAAEELVLSAITAATFGGASELQAARTIKLASQIGKIAKRTTELSNEIHNASRLRKIWTGITSATGNLLPVGNTIDFARGFKTLRRADELAMGANMAAKARTTARGFGAFYRDFREMNVAISEAKAEAAGTYSEMTDRLTENFIEKYNREPNDIELDNIKETALAASHSNGAANTALILLTNKLAFGNVLKGFRPLRYMLDEDVMKGLVVLGEKDAAKVGMKVITSADNKWLYYKNAILSKPLKYVGANLSEALQENAQDLSNQAVQAWYMSKANGQQLDSKFDAIRDAAIDQFSVQGAKTFISGFFTGTILGAGSRAFENAGSLKQMLTDKEGYTDRKTKSEGYREQVKQTINAIYANPLKYTYNKDGAALQSNFATLLKQAAEAGDKKGFNDIQDDATRQFILTGISSGTLDLLTDRVGDYIKNLSPEEFTEAFGVEYSREHHSNMIEQATKFQARANDIQELHSRLTTSYINPFNPAKFKPNTEEFMDEAMNFMAYKEALNQMVFMQDTYNRTVSRQQEVLDSIKNKPGFEQVAFNNIYSLTSLNQLNTELALLQQEAASSADPKVAEEKNKKIARLTKYKELLTDYLSAIDNIQTSRFTPEATAALVESALNKFNKNGSPLFMEHINEDLAKNNLRTVQVNDAKEAFNNLADYFNLQKDSEALLENINFVIDPENFPAYLDRHLAAYREFAKSYREKEESSEGVVDTEVEVLEVAEEVEDENETDGQESDQEPSQEKMTFSEDSARALFMETGFFKTVGLHFFDDDTTLNKENNSHKFFRFTERMVFAPDTYFLVPVTKDNDTFGIRREDKFTDDVKLIVVKKEGKGFKYVGIDGQVLDNPTKDTIIYTSMVGNKTLFGDDKAAALADIKRQFTMTGVSDEMALAELEGYKAFLAGVKEQIKNKEQVVFPVVGKSKGVIKLAPLDGNGRSQELSLQGVLIKPDTEDYLNMEHPSGESIEVVMATVENAINMAGVKPGRIVMRAKESGNVYRVYNRQMTQEERDNVKELLKSLTLLMGKNKKLTKAQERNKKDILKYLMGVLHWSPVKEGKEITDNQFYISKGKLHRGTTVVPFTAAGIESNAAKLFDGLYHSVNNKFLNARDPFFEVTTTGGAINTREWTSYNAYLMSQDEGRRPVLFTNVAPFNPDLNSEDYQLAGVYLKFDSLDEPVSSKVPAVTSGTEAAPVQESATPSLKFKRQGAAQPDLATQTTPEAATTETPAKGLKFKKTAETTQTDNTAASTPATPAAAPANPALDAAALAAVLAQNTKAAEEDGNDEFSNVMYRLKTSGAPVKKEDFLKLNGFMQRALPQVAIHRMAELIHNKAYGAVMNGAIHIYENAEEGTGFHEAFEMVWLAYLTDSERAGLAKEFSSRTGNFYNPFSKQTKSYSEATMYDVREMLAEEFRSFILEGKAATPQAKNFFQRLWDFIKSIVGLGTQERAELDSIVNQIFNKINDGSFANATAIRNLETSDAVYRSVPGVTQEVTNYAVEGVTAFFFMNLYKNNKNIDALLEEGANNNPLLVELFNQSLQDLDLYMRGENNAQFKKLMDAYAKQVGRPMTDQERVALFDSVYAPQTRLGSQVSILMNQPMELYDVFKNYVSKFGLTFTEKMGEEEINEGDESDALGIRDSIKIDPRKFGSTNFRMLIGGLTDDAFNPKKGIIQFKRNPLGLPKLLNYERTYAILLNELNGSVSYVQGGAVVNATDEMFKRLDGKFKKGKSYKEGYEWIQRLKVRLKYETAMGQRVDVNSLTADDIELRVAFEQNLSNMQNKPLRTILAENGLVYSDDSLTTASKINVKDQWKNALQDTAVPFFSKDGVKLLGIDDVSGRMVFDTNSEEYQQIMTAKNFEEAIAALEHLGISFSGTPAMLRKYETEITDAFGAIRQQISEGNINSIEGLFSKAIVNGRINALLQIETELAPEENVLMHRNAEGESQYTITLPSTTSYVLNSLKAAATLTDFVQSNPQFGRVNASGQVELHPYQRRSLLLKPGGILFDKNGKKKKDGDIQYHLISGVATQDSDGKNTDVLTYPDRLMQEINHLINNIHYTIINSDKSTEYALGVNAPFVTYRDADANPSKILSLYKDQLEDEMDAAIAEKANPSNIQYYSDNVMKLGHFRDILGPKLVAEFQEVLNGNKSRSSFLASRDLDKAITDYIAKEVTFTRDALVDLGILKETPVDTDQSVYATNAIGADNLAKLDASIDPQNMSAAEVEALVTYLVVNKELAVTEQHKLIYGHPALYKDLAKRSNGANSTKSAIVDNMEIRQWMDQNMARLDGKQRSAETISTFKNISFQDNTVLARLVTDYAENMYASMSKSQKKAEAETRVGAKFTKEGKFKSFIMDGKKFTGEIAKYINVNEVDAQAWIMPDMYRDMLYLSARMTRKQQKQWNYEKAYEIVARSQKDQRDPAYKAYDESTLDQARKTLSLGNPGVVMQVLKPQYFGYDANSALQHTVFLKNSTQPKFYRQVEGTQFERLYLAAQANQVDVIGFESGHKVGNMVNANGTFTAIYNPKGELNIELDANGIAQLPDMPVQTLLTRYFGIQQEVPNVFKDAVVRGSQVTKLIMANYKVNGQFTSKEAEQLVTEYNDILSQMIALGKTKLLQELGVTTDSVGNYKATDINKMARMLKDEAKKRDLPDNIVDAINTITTEIGTDFQYPLDTLTNREKIDNILNSIVNSRVISEKMNGKPAVQVSSALFEAGNREFVYLKDGVYTTTKGVKMEDLTAAEQASVRMVSNDLKFYELKDGKISNMEVYLPFYLEGMDLGSGALRNGLVNIDLKKIDKRILKALGFRIPTQGMNSIESITIKGFLPREMGDMIVVPSEITGKSGSDFDIDKLQVYLANYYITGGRAKYYEWQGSQEATKAFYEKVYDNGELLSPEEQVELDRFIAEENDLADDMMDDAEGRLMRAMFSRSFDVDVITEEFMSGIRNREQRKAKAVEAAVKKAMQNRYVEIMQDLVSLPENMRQLITPNSTDTLKGLADEIMSLKGETNTIAGGYASLRGLVNGSDIRHRFLSGKKLVGIAALQITSHVMAQLGDIQLSGNYDPSRLYYLVGDKVYDKLINIRLSHNNTDDKLMLNALEGKDGLWISDLVNEALSGFVDAAKDPFVFTLNLTLDTAGTWFYLQKLGVPIKELGYFFNQPVLNDYFKEVAVNKSFFKNVSGEKLQNMLVTMKAVDKYYRLVDPQGRSIFNNMLDLMEAGDRKGAKKLRLQFGDTMRKAQAAKASLTEAELRDAIKRMNAKGYEMTKEDAEMQLGIMADYLEYNEQAQNLTDFIRGIGYDNTKTKSIQENVSQVTRWDKVVKRGFIANPQSLLDNTFIKELKKQKEDIFKLFTPFFVTLDPRAQAAFQPMIDLINTGVFMTNDQQADLINKYQNFIINYLVQTVPFKSGSKDARLYQYANMFSGDNSMAKQLKKYRESEDRTISENPFIRELLPMISSDGSTTDNIKMLRSSMDTYKINSIIEGAKELLTYAQQTANTDLEKFMKKMAIFTVLQGGNQPGYTNFTRLMPVELYSELVKTILDNFKNDPTIEVNVPQLWKQFHQNNWRDDAVVPKAKFARKKGNFLMINKDMDESARPFVKRTRIRPGLDKARIEQLKKDRQFDQLFETILYERFDEDGVNAFYRPINKKGLGNRYTEVSNFQTNSLITNNNTVDEAVYYPGMVSAEKEDDSEVTAPAALTTTVNIPAPTAPVTEKIGTTTIMKMADNLYDIQDAEDGVIAEYVPTIEEARKIAEENEAKKKAAPAPVAPVVTAQELSVTETSSTSSTLPQDKKYELFPGVFANEGQRAAIDKMEAFLTGDQDQFLLKGRGGTGKTTIVQKALQGVSKTAVVGATVSYEAKNVLQENMKGFKTVTVASLLGLVADYDSKTGALFFRERNADEERAFRGAGKVDPIEKYPIIIVDEASMVGDFIYGKILQKKAPGAKVLFMADNVQIPPIDAESGDSPVFNLAAGGNFAELSERMRQGAESPILPVTDVYAQNVEKMQNGMTGVTNPLTTRVNNLENNEGVSFISSADELVTQFVADLQSNPSAKAAVVVGARNATVDNFNDRIREKIFNTEEAYVPGDFIRVNTVHMKDGEVVFENGFKGKVVNIREAELPGYNFTTYSLTVEHEFVDVDGKLQKATATMQTISPKDKAKFKGVLAQMAVSAKKFARGTSEYKRAWKEFYSLKESIVDVGYGYAITSHKVQGSTYDNVYVLENDIMTFPGGPEQVNRMMYTAVSRPRKKLVIFNAAGIGGASAAVQTPTGLKFRPGSQVQEVLDNKDKGCKQ